MLDAAAWQKDMADTADLLAELDLLITCDTAVAHVAGALGRPVWTLLAHAADWRWMTKRADTPWYPTMRLFRQPRPGDWRSVAGEVERALAAMDRHTPGVGRARPN
jgi:ADP-heptose:LPS heptosyltransferase